MVDPPPCLPPRLALPSWARHTIRGGGGSARRERHRSDPLTYHAEQPRCRHRQVDHPTRGVKPIGNGDDDRAAGSLQGDRHLCAEWKPGCEPSVRSYRSGCRPPYVCPGAQPRNTTRSPSRWPSPRNRWFPTAAHGRRCAPGRIGRQQPDPAVPVAANFTRHLSPSIAGSIAGTVRHRNQTYPGPWTDSGHLPNIARTLPSKRSA